MTRRTATSTGVRQVYVALIADVFADGSGIFEGGAERHLLQLLLAMRRAGIDGCVYQPGSRAATLSAHGVEVRVRPVRRHLWEDLAHQALDDGATHLYFKYVEHVPRGLSRAQVSATQHGIHWDIPYERHGQAWYRGGSMARAYLPAWRSLQLGKSLAGLHRARAVSAMDTSFLRVTQALWPELRQRLFVTAPFCDLSPESTGPGGQARLPAVVAEAIDAVHSIGGCAVLVPRNLSLVRGESWLPAVAAAVVARRPTLFVATGRFLGPLDPDRRRARLDVDATGEPSGISGSVPVILHLGGVERALMPALFDAADIVLIPTFAHEGASLGAAEAMAFGKPVVATNVGGLNDTLDDGWTGIVTRADPDSLAAGVLRLAGDPQMMKAVGSMARQKAETCFDLARWQASQRPFFTAAGWTDGSELR